MEATSDNAVREAPEANNAPEFPAASVEVEVKESVTGGGNVGDLVTATDADDDVLTYSLSGGVDKDAFGIVPASGQITVGADTKLDYETRTSYMVEVKAEDPFGRSDTVIDVDEPPVPVIKVLWISGGMAEVDYAENGTGPVEIYTAQGPEGAIVTWSVAGTDAGDFTIDGGVLRFKSIPDYESPTDDGGDNEYDVTVEATDGTNNDMLIVVVTVTDVEKVGEGLDELSSEERRDVLQILLDRVMIDRDNNVVITLGIPTDDLVAIGNPEPESPCTPRW